MPRRLNVLTVLAFCAFLVLPLGLLCGFGAAKPYGRDYTPFPDHLTKLLHGSPTARKQLSSALFERSPATVFAIRTHNAALYRVVGTVDNDEMVSGKDDWLFYKEEFWGGKCLSDDVIATTLRTIDTMATMSAAAGLPILFSVSPDKSTIHPEMLGKRASIYAGCKAQNGERWREMAKRLAPDLLDHATAILQKDNPKVPYYYATDTHWNSRGGVLAASQLVSVLEGTPPSTPLLYAETPYEERTDLRNTMLLLDGTERDIRVTAFTAPRQNAKPAMFIIDSFYGVARPEFEKAFPGSQFYSLEDNEKEYTEELQDHDGQVVVNSVERYLFLRFGNWNNALARAILERNMTIAQRCTYDAPLDLGQSAKLDEMEQTGPGSYLGKSADPNMIVSIPEKADCVRVAVDVPGPAVFEMFMPVIVGRDDPDQFAEGRSIDVDLPTGKSVLTFMLPTGRAGKELRIDPVNAPWRFKVDEVSFGTIKEQ